MVDYSPKQLMTVLRNMGLKGVVQSLYHTKRHDIAVPNLVLGKRVLSQISPEANLTLDSPFLMQVLPIGMFHPRQLNSLLTIREDASFTVPDSDGVAQIGAGSTVKVLGDFRMGDSYINSRAKILCTDEISIGDGCSIAWDVTLLDGDRHDIRYDERWRRQTAPITVEDEVWIGHDVTVKKGVTVGEGAVISSHSVVTKDIPPRTLAVGSPAQVVKHDVVWG